MIDLDRALEVARSAVEAAARVALPHWQFGVPVETKGDGSPVTMADREAEAEILKILGAAFPGHAILGEETGAHAGEGGARWIVDPIDGTRGYTRGGRFWGSLVGLEVDGEIVVGAMSLPALDEVFWAAKGRGCHHNGDPVKLRSAEKWSECTVSLGEMAPLFGPPHGDAVRDLVRTAASARGYGDVAGVAMVLRGLADVWLEAGVKPWDLAPARILLEEAGGVFTTFAGDTDLDRGTAIGGTPALHAHALARIQAQHG